MPQSPEEKNNGKIRNNEWVFHGEKRLKNMEMLE